MRRLCKMESLHFKLNFSFVFDVDSCALTSAVLTCVICFCHVLDVLTLTVRGRWATFG